jgi:hypothetical protein
MVQCHGCNAIGPRIPNGNGLPIQQSINTAIEKWNAGNPLTTVARAEPEAPAPTPVNDFAFPNPLSYGQTRQHYLLAQILSGSAVVLAQYSENIDVRALMGRTVDTAIMLVDIVNERTRGS